MPGSGLALLKYVDFTRERYTGYAGCVEVHERGRKLLAPARIWHIPDSQRQVLALAFRSKSIKPFNVFLSRSAWVKTSYAGDARCGGAQEVGAQAG